MSRRKIITILVALGLLIVLIAVFRSCRGGHRPPAEQDALEGTSYRVDTRATPTQQAFVQRSVAR